MKTNSKRRLQVWDNLMVVGSGRGLELHTQGVECDSYYMSYNRNVSKGVIRRRVVIVRKS